MDSPGAAALTSWNLDPLSIALFVAIAAVYLRGWLRIRELIRTSRDTQRLTAFLAGIILLFIALDSPLDSFDNLFLSAHMAQHLLLMMFVPPLLLFGHPVLPLLRGLPKSFVKEGLGPFLAWPFLKRLGTALVAPPVAWVLFVGSTIAWHLPPCYEAAISSSWIHSLEHACFFWTGILFWWPIIRPAPGKSRWPEWVIVPYLLAGDVVNTLISLFFVFSGQLLYPSYGVIHASSMSPLTDQTIAGLIMWVPGSVVYLVPAFVFGMRLLASPKMRNREEKVQRVSRVEATQQVKRSQLPLYRRIAQVAMLMVAVAVMADGFFGKQIAPMNLAGVLPWIHWRALSIIALLAMGNLFCMACPFTLVRDATRKVLPAKLRWPSALRTKWVGVGLIVLYLWIYEAFGLWDSPWLTAWIIAGYFGAAVLIDCIFRGASFCKYVCPIGQFHFINSLISPREVRVKSQQICKSCQTYDCIRGNEHTRGCELYLFQPKKESNLDCTFCLDCVKACPTQNVSILPVIPVATVIKDPYRSSIGRLSRRTDLAALALVIVFGAFVNAAGMTAPVMTWEHHWHARLGQGAMPWVVAAFIFSGGVLSPLAATFVCGGLNRAFTGRSKELIHRFAFALVPIGFAMWLAHLFFHFVSSWTILATINSGWLTSTQILMLDCGLLLTLYVSWQIANQYTNQVRGALAILAPWALVAGGLYAAGLWILFQPMQMRGLM